MVYKVYALRIEIVKKFFGKKYTMIYYRGDKKDYEWYYFWKKINKIIFYENYDIDFRYDYIRIKGLKDDLLEVEIKDNALILGGKNENTKNSSSQIWKFN